MGIGDNIKSRFICVSELRLSIFADKFFFVVVNSGFSTSGCW